MPVSFMTSVEIARPVKRGGEKFLNAAKHIGAQLVTPDFSNGGFLWRDGTPIGAPRFNPYGKLMLPLIQIAAPGGSETSALLHYIAQRLEDDSQPAQRLRTNLAHLALEKDVSGQDGIVIRCSAITVSSPPHKDGQELVLVPDITDEATGLAVQLFSGEHDLLMGGIHDNVRWHKRFAEQEQRYGAVIPIGTVAEDITPQEQATVAASLGAFLPLRLVIGEQLPVMVR